MSEENNGMTRRDAIKTVAGAASFLAGCGRDGSGSTSTPSATGSYRGASDVSRSERNAYETLEDVFDDLENNRTGDDFYLDSQVESRNGGSYYEGFGVQATENVILASRDVQDQEINILDEDQEEFVWYGRELPALESSLSPVRKILKEEGLYNFRNEKLGDSDNSPGYTVLEDYMEAAVDDFEGIAPFVRLSDHGEPIFSDETIEDFEDKYDDLKELKNDYRDLLFGPQNPVSLQDLRADADDSKPSFERAVEQLYDTALRNYAGLLLLDEVYEETVDRLETGQELAEGGEFNENGEPTDTPEEETPTEETETETPEEETPEETDTPEEETPTEEIRYQSFSEKVLDEDEQYDNLTDREREELVDPFIDDMIKVGENERVSGLEYFNPDNWTDIDSSVWKAIVGDERDMLFDGDNEGSGDPGDISTIEITGERPVDAPGPYRDTEVMFEIDHGGPHSSDPDWFQKRYSVDPEIAEELVE